MMPNHQSFYQTNVSHTVPSSMYTLYFDLEFFFEFFLKKKAPLPTWYPRMPFYDPSNFKFPMMCIMIANVGTLCKSGLLAASGVVKRSVSEGIDNPSMAATVSIQTV